MDFELILKDYKNEIDTELEKNLIIKRPEIIYEAMRYSVFAGGKRIRPLFMLAICDILGGDTKKCLPFAAALEMIHTYSLIHDDLPAMDNDDYRRGKLTSHKVYGEAMAVLAGDALLNKAFEIASFECIKNPEFITALSCLADSAGVCGMIGGQVEDILSENKKIDFDDLLFIHNYKTGALINAAFKIGAIIGGADDGLIEKISNLANKFGLAFQIKDDILDITSTQEVLGKPVNSDFKNSKNTYVSICGIEKSIQDYNILSEEILNEIKIIFGDNNILYYLINKILNRVN